MRDQSQAFIGGRYALSEVWKIGSAVTSPNVPQELMPTREDIFMLVGTLAVSTVLYLAARIIENKFPPPPPPLSHPAFPH